MKSKSLWLFSLSLLGVCGWSVWTYALGLQPKGLIGIQSGAVLVTQTPLPILHWGNPNTFGDLGLQLDARAFIDLESANLEETVRFNNQAYTQIQPGFFLVTLADQRIFIFTDPFDPSQLNPEVAVNFESDWVVLQRSSLLPQSWPFPSQGWVVLGSQISDSLKQASIKTQKPVVRPSNQGTIWLEKTPETSWQVLLP